jgi:phosphoenolpyruvate-protein phosphotransferase/dihydroxyacetone kinase phosphotransfer subunit
LISIVLVSHSRALAEGVAELAREMGGEEVAIVAAGGLEDDPEAIGTDAVRVQQAIERVRGEDGVLVLMDLGSALMSAEMAVEMAGGDGPVVLSEAPLVEGAVAAAARARGGATLDEVAAEARGALRMKAEQLGAESAPAESAPAATGDELRLTVDIPLGLHARPAARLAGLAGGFASRMTVRNASRERGPADARSLTGIATLNVRQGDEIVVTADGDDAADALAAVRELAGEHWGDDPNVAAPAPRATSAPTATDGRLSGVPAASGIAVGPARPLAGPRLEASDAPAGAPADERAALDAALAAASEDVRRDRAEVARRAGEAEAAIFDAHAALLADPDLLAAADGGIDDGRSAAQAWVAAVKDAAETYRGLEDDYLRERAVDVEDVGARVLGHMQGAVKGEAGEGIVIAGELTPAQAAQLDPALVQGIAGAHGGATSHAAILARALDIPAVVGLGPALLAIEPGTPLVLDGDAGTVEVDPGEEALADARRRRDEARERAARLRATAREPAHTADGERVEVFANLGNPREARPAVEQGAEGVGLLRTEFLFLDRDEPPDEEEQVAVYSEIAQALDGRPLVLRTLDAGADKPLPFLRQPPEENPFLGVRGIRLSLEQPDLLRTQLRAAARVAAEHPLKVMFPMVATLEEVRAARALVDEVGAPDGMEVGVMVEVPAVALQAERFAREVDFFSIGTNDLTQYALAAERGNERLAQLLDGPVPAVLRLIAAVVEGARAHGRWVGVCGELAGDPDAAVLLAGLGVAELSMAGGRIPQVKAALRAVTLADARQAAARALDADDAAAARSVGASLWR